MEPLSLYLPGLVLRPWTDDDLDAFWSASQDPATRLWNPVGDGSREAARAVLARRQDWSSGDHASFAVVSRDGGRLLGGVSLHAIDLHHGNAQIGYFVAAPARGRGIATAVVDGSCSWAFTSLGIERVELIHSVENAASGRVAAKAGFTCEGRLRRSWRCGDGVKRDELLWGRLSDDPAVPGVAQLG